MTLTQHLARCERLPSILPFSLQMLTALPCSGGVILRNSTRAPSRALQLSSARRGRSVGHAAPATALLPAGPRGNQALGWPETVRGKGEKRHEGQKWARAVP